MKSISLVLIALSLLMTACSSDKNANELHVVTSAEYPPFEYQEFGVLKGFDIELAQVIAEKLGKTAQFENMQFSSVLPALSAGRVDAAISTITITAERQKNVAGDKVYTNSRPRGRRSWSQEGIHFFLSKKNDGRTLIARLA